MLDLLNYTAAAPVIIILAMVIFFVGLHAIVLYCMPAKETENEIASIVTHLIGMLYAVLLGFVAVSAWGDFDHANQNIKAEENALADLYRLSSGFPEAVRGPVQRDILAYAKLMPSEEWAAMQTGASSARANALALHILEDLNELRPQSISESNIQNEALSLAHTFLDARRTRINKIDEGMPTMLWITLFVGAFFMIGFTFCLRQTHYLQQLFMTGVLAALIGLLFSLILEFEYPFRGKIVVSSSGWTKFVEKIETNALY